jgi:Holliday junction resolvase RusA-like endonuclease
LSGSEFPTILNWQNITQHTSRQNMTNHQHDLNQPPKVGELTFSFSLEPVSLQSSGVRKEFVRSEIKKVTRKINYLLSGDVKIDIQWLVFEQERYENPNSPDMDNIIKPILDGLSGPDGLLIDDCQVQTVSSHWTDWTKKEHKINITIQYIPDDYVTKKNLLFVNIGDNLCMPFHSDLPQKANELILNHLENGMNLRNEMLKQTANYYQAKLFMSIQRVFHKSRIYDNYDYIDIKDFKQKLKL